MRVESSRFDFKPIASGRNEKRPPAKHITTCVKFEFTIRVMDDVNTAVEMPGGNGRNLK